MKTLPPTPATPAPAGQKPARRLPAHILLCLLLAMGCAMPALAQNNPYKISDSLYPYYEQARTCSDSELSLTIADTLRRKAVEMGDKKAECLAYTIPVSHYFKLRNAEKLARAVEELKQVARRNDYLQYYYYAWNQQIVLMFNSSKSFEALQENERMKAQALKDNHPYGIFTCLRNQGHIQKARRNTKLAMKCYHEALDYMLEHLPDQEPTNTYLNLAEYYLTREPKKALEYIEQGMKSARTESNVITCKAQKAVLMAQMGDSAAFYRLYKEVTRSKYYKPTAMGNLSFQNLSFEKALIDRNYEEAKRIARFTPPDYVDRYILLGRVYSISHDYYNAYRCQRRVKQLDDSVHQLIQAQDIAALNAQLGNERLRQENAQLDLQNAQLQLEKMQQSSLLTGIVIVLLLAIVSILAYDTHRKRLNERRLRRMNEELTEANKRIKAADRMKTLFIQNMSHEIRTPLNSIVGFSQIIAAPDMELGKEERKEYAQLIEKNSELLTTLVNDILDLSELESGRMNIHPAPCHVNGLCHEVIATVAHRTPKGVKLCCTSEAADDFTLTTDAARVKQVLINLLTNAAKHTTQGEISLHCSLSEHPGRVTLAVTDTGCGIPAEEAEHIFERFSKLDEFEQGFGLGLHICRLIATRLNGEVKLDTTYSGGARFVLVL